MKKLIFILIFALCLSGCTKPVTIVSQSGEKDNQQKQPQGNDLIKCSMSTDEGRFGAGYANDRQVLFYIDYASATEVALCSAPSCAHNSEGCTALIEENQNVNYLYTAGSDKLVVATYGKFAADAPKLIIMDKDGGNRKELCVGKSGERFEGPVAIDNENVYFLLEQDKKDDFKILIASVSLEGGEAKQAIEISNRSTSVLGISGRDFYFYEFDWSEMENTPRPMPPENATKEEMNKLDDEYNSKITGKHTVYKINVDTGEKTLVMNWTSPVGSSGKAMLMLGDTIYWGDRQTLGIISADGTTQEIAINWPTALKEKDDLSTIDAIIDGKAIVNIYNAPENIVTRYSIDLTTGNALPMNLTYISNGHVRPVSIGGVSKDSLLIQYDCRMEEAVEIGPDGTPMNFFKVTNSYAMISYADFFENKPNYKQINTAFATDLFGY